MIIFLFFLTWATTFSLLTFLTGLSYYYAFLWFFIGLLSGYIFVVLSIILTIPFVFFVKKTNKLKHYYLLSLCDFVRLFVIRLHIVEIKGKENIPKDGAFGIYSNHRSGADALIGLSVIRVPLAFVAKDSIFINKLVSKWLKGFGIIELDRNNARKALMEINQGVELMQEGLSMLVFPEGTRKQDDFHNLDSFKAGAFKLSTKSKVPILPIAIIGAEEYHKNYLRRKTSVRVIIGKPIAYEDYKDLNSQQISDKVAGKIMKMLKENETLS